MKLDYTAIITQIVFAFLDMYVSVRDIQEGQREMYFQKVAENIERGKK